MYNVLQLDMATMVSSARDSDVVLTTTEAVVPVLRKLVPDAGRCAASSKTLLADALCDVVRSTGRRFVFVIDEWDALYSVMQACGFGATGYESARNQRERVCGDSHDLHAFPVAQKLDLVACAHPQNVADDLGELTCSD